MIVDMHAHFVPTAMLEELARGCGFPSVQTKSGKEGPCFSFAGRRFARPIPPLKSMAEQERSAIAGGTAASLFRIA